MILCSMTPKGCYDWSYELPYVALEASLALDPDYIMTAQAHPECYKILFSDS